MVDLSIIVDNGKVYKITLRDKGVFDSMVFSFPSLDYPFVVHTRYGNLTYTNEGLLVRNSENDFDIVSYEEIKESSIDLSTWKEGDILVSRGGIVITQCRLNEEDATKSTRPYKVGESWLVTREGKTLIIGEGSKFDIIAHINGNDANTIHNIIKKVVE